MSETEDLTTPIDLMEYLDDLGYSMEDESEMTNLEEDLPTAVIVANIPSCVFENVESQRHFEGVFKELDKDVTFIYLKNFRRARLQFSSSTMAGVARLKYDGLSFGTHNIKCYFSQVQQQVNSANTFLRPPEPKRMFLISPPASPPVGWEPVPESDPIIDYDLLNALARLSPGETHEIHPKSLNAPSIVVHLCEEPEGKHTGPKPAIVQTRRPDISMT